MPTPMFEELPTGSMLAPSQLEKVGLKHRKFDKEWGIRCKEMSELKVPQHIAEAAEMSFHQTGEYVDYFFYADSPMSTVYLCYPLTYEATKDAEYNLRPGDNYFAVEHRMVGSCASMMEDNGFTTNIVLDE